MQVHRVLRRRPTAKVAAERPHEWFSGAGYQKRGRSSAGRAPALQAGCQGFESPRLHFGRPEDGQTETQRPFGVVNTVAIIATTASTRTDARTAAAGRLSSRVNRAPAYPSAANNKMSGTDNVNPRIVYALHHMTASPMSNWAVQARPAIAITSVVHPAKPKSRAAATVAGRFKRADLPVPALGDDRLTDGLRPAVAVHAKCDSFELMIERNRVA